MASAGGWARRDGVCLRFLVFEWAFERGDLIAIGMVITSFHYFSSCSAPSKVNLHAKLRAIMHIG
jgi:hypothetical protein